MATEEYDHGPVSEIEERGFVSSVVGLAAAIGVRLGHVAPARSRAANSPESAQSEAPSAGKESTDPERLRVAVAAASGRAAKLADQVDDQTSDVEEAVDVGLTRNRNPPERFLQEHPTRVQRRGSGCADQRSETGGEGCIWNRRGIYERVRGNARTLARYKLCGSIIGLWYVIA